MNAISNKYSSTCFVITPFGKPGSEACLHSDTLRNLVLSPVLVGMRVIRSNDVYHKGPWYVKMCEYLKTADLCVADLSSMNPNCMFEIGYRCLLEERVEDKHTILICPEMESENVPSDIESLQIIYYKDINDELNRKILRGKIKDAYEDLVNEGKINQGVSAKGMSYGEDSALETNVLMSDTSKTFDIMPKIMMHAGNRISKW